MNLNTAMREYWIRQSLMIYEKEVGDYKGDKETRVIDFLADLMYYCEMNDIDYDKAVTAAEKHFNEERKTI